MKTVMDDNYNDYEVIVSMLWWQKKGLMKTATGYGSKIETIYKIKYRNRLYRLYCDIYSNSGVTYIISQGKKIYLH